VCHSVITSQVAHGDRRREVGRKAHRESTAITIVTITTVTATTMMMMNLGLSRPQL
jgi:hypothetical protein